MERDPHDLAAGQNRTAVGYSASGGYVVRLLRHFILFGFQPRALTPLSAAGSSWWAGGQDPRQEGWGPKGSPQIPKRRPRPSTSRPGHYLTVIDGVELLHLQVDPGRKDVRYWYTYIHRLCGLPEMFPHHDINAPTRS